MVAIPDTSYDRLPEAEFAAVKQPIAYTIDLIAEREGSVDLKVRVLSNGRVERTAVYLGVALGSSGHARLSVRPGTGQAASPGRLASSQGRRRRRRYFRGHGPGEWRTRRGPQRGHPRCCPDERLTRSPCVTVLGLVSGSITALSRNRPAPCPRHASGLSRDHRPSARGLASRSRGRAPRWHSRGWCALSPGARPLQGGSD
jgi:hypothetical protein